MARKTRQSAKPHFAPLRPTALFTERSDDALSSPFSFPSVATLFKSNTRWIHASCAEATRPSDEELANVRVDDLVKVRFDSPQGKERMWVKITARTEDGFTGILDNTPHLMTDIQWGDTVTFTAGEIVALNL